MVNLIKRLRELEAAATPGEWWYDGINYIFQRHPQIGDRMVAEIRGFGGGLPMDTNAALIAEMRNVLPQLLNRLEKLEAVADAAKYVVPGLVEDYGPDTSDMASLRTALAALGENK